MKIFSRISASLFIITLLGFFSFVSVNKVQAAPTCNATTGNWSDPSIWSGACTGVDGIPSSSDSVGIDADVVVTVNTAGAVASSITFWDHQDTVNGINVVSPGTLTVSNQIDLTPMSSDFGNSTIDVGDGTLSVANINIDGDGYGDGFGPVALSVSTGTINVSGDITFSGIAENAQLISTGDSTINIGGSLTSGGTLTTSGTGTINFNGSGEQAMGAYDTYNNVEISSTGAGVFLDGAVNIGGNLAINSGGLDTNGNTFTFSGTDKTITGTLEISTLQITGSITNNGTLTVGTDLSGAGTLTNGATGILNLYYLPTITTLVADTVGNTVNYTNSGGITVLDVDYYNLNLLGDGTITFGGEIAIANNLSINSGLNLDFGVTNSTTNGLILGGDAKIAGTWGSYGSGATNRNNDYFSGNRLIDVSNLTSAPDVPTAEAGPTIDATEDADGFDVVVSLGTSGAIEGDVLELLLNDESIVVTAGTPGTVGETTYTGTGLGDATFGGQYDGTGEGCQILAGILDLAPENGYDNDRFIFGFSGESCDSGDNSGIEITPGIAQDIESGITITFDAGTGHTLLEMDPLNENWSADLTSGIPDTHVAHTLTSDNILAGSDSFSIPSGVLGLDGEKSFSARIIRVGTNGTESDPLVLTLDTTTDEPEPVRRRSSGSSSVSFNRPTAPTPTPNTEVPSTPNFTFTKNLKFRMNDIEVQELQKFLNNNGFPVSTEGAGSKGFETNFFGAKTRAALVAFQKANNITPAVGYFGPITRGVINGMIQ